MQKLKDLEVYELSLVRRGANKKKFFLLKSMEEKKMEDLLKKLLELDFENEAEIDAKIVDSLPENIKKQEDEVEKIKASLKAALRLLTSVKEKLPEQDQNKIMQLISSLAGYGNNYGYAYGYAEPPKTMKGERMEEKEKKETPEIPTDVKEKLDTLWKEREELVKKNEELLKELQAEKEVRIKKEFQEKAETFKNLNCSKEDLATLLKSASEKLGDDYKKLEEILKGADKLIGESKAFQEVGSSAPSTTSSAYQKIEKLAEEIKKNDPKLTHEMALAKALENNPELYNEYENERSL